jgi:lipoprotein-releasing system permease protein
VIFPLYIARRYLLSKKSHNIINIISIISVAGITVGSMALIIILSVFNGFEGLVMGMFNSFNPDLQVTVKMGKTFPVSAVPEEKIKQIPGVKYIVPVVEENAIASFEDKQHIVVLKGVGKDFTEMTPLDSFMLNGTYKLRNEQREFAVIGAGVAYYLDLYPEDFTTPLTLYEPKRTKKNFSGMPDESFNSARVQVSGVFSVQNDYDMEYIILPIDIVRRLLNYSDEVTSLDIGLVPGTDLKTVQEQVQALMGNDYYVKNHYQQQALLYKVMRSEKWAVYLILTFILLIAAFNMIGSLSMLILDKKKDISVLWSLGADKTTIKRIFFTEGMLISVTGGLAGLVLGGIIAFLQQRFGIIKLGGGQGNYVVDAYPVVVQALDFLYVLLTVLIIGALTAWYPVRQISRKYLSQRLNFFLMR